MLDELKEKVYRANLDLVRHKLVVFTWGNVSGIDRERGLVVIKPSGVSYDAMRPDDMVVVSLETGKVVEGHLRPSSDTPTHLELYRAFPEIGGVAHSHSTYATAWAQAGMAILNVGTTQADYFYGDIPCTDDMRPEQMAEYEHNTGVAITEKFIQDKLDYHYIPGALVRNHGPFVWGKTPDEAVYHAVVVEEVAKMNYLTFTLNPQARISELLVEKHFSRKHGPHAYYGQENK